MAKRIERIDVVLADVLKRTAAQQRPLFAVQRQWRALVGRALAAHSKPVSLRRGRLLIHVASSGDAHALTYQRATLLPRLKAVTNDVVEELVFRAGDV